MSRIFFLIGAIMLFLGSCSKNGEPIVQMKNTSLELRALTVDTLILQVEVSDGIVINRMTSPSVAAVPHKKYVDPATRLRIRNLYDNRIMLDTAIIYKPHITTVNAVQTGANSNLVIPGPAVNEPAPPAGRTKISFVYVATMPDEVKVVAENSQSGVSDLDYVPTDSFLLRKGQFSPYTLGWDGTRNKPRLKVYTPDARRLLIGEFRASLFSQASSGINIYLLEMITASFARATKLY